MTKKPIMIDDVDVSGCRYFAQREDGGKCELFYNENCHCSTRTYCYYKDYKRKEQECEKIKKWVKGMMFDTDCSNWFERFTTAFEDWKNDLISQLNQLKQAVQEIKKLVEKDYCSEYETCKECYDSSTCKNNCINKEILQKCEVVDD